MRNTMVVTYWRGRVHPTVEYFSSPHSFSEIRSPQYLLFCVVFLDCCFDFSCFSSFPLGCILLLTSCFNFLIFHKMLTWYVYFSLYLYFVRVHISSLLLNSYLYHFVPTFLSETSKLCVIIIWCCPKIWLWYCRYIEVI